MTGAPRAEADSLFDAGEYASALQRYAALAQGHADPALLVNIAYCRLMLDEPQAAEQNFREALKRNQALAPAWVGLGDALAAQNRHTEALPCYDRALALDESLAAARNNRAQSLTALGRLAEAWRDAETRYAVPGAAQSLYPHRLDLPQWQGEAGKRVLVHWEQGYGDMLQHLRFLPLMQERCSGYAFECPPPLQRLMERSLPQVPLMQAQHTPPDTRAFDCIAPLLSLPLRLGIDAETLPGTPYLQLPAATTRQGIAIVWRASAFDAARSLPLTGLLSALQGALRSGVPVLSLQHAPSDEERALLAAHGVADASSSLQDFHDTAQALTGVRLLISVDTAAAHLAGALGVPVLLLLNEPAATRWMLAREDSPWYASLRLLRKPRGEPWTALLERATKEAAAC